jgi:hypothetical protein
MWLHLFVTKQRRVELYTHDLWLTSASASPRLQRGLFHLVFQVHPLVTKSSIPIISFSHVCVAGRSVLSVDRMHFGRRSVPIDLSEILDVGDDRVGVDMYVQRKFVCDWVCQCCGSQFELRPLSEGISQVRVDDVEGRMTFGAGHGRRS